jgi:hypothetical protein
MAMKRSLVFMLSAFALVACSGSKPPEIENVALPSGQTVKMIGVGTAPVWHGIQPIGLRYEPNASMDDAAALHAEALGIWRFFRFQAEGKKYEAAVLTAQANGRTSDVRFQRVNGTWYEVDANGKPIETAPPRLSGPVAAMSWMLGTWTCDFRFAADKFSSAHPTVVINEAGAGGATVLQTYSESWGPGAMLGEAEIGYDSAQKTWFRRGRQSPGGAETDSATGAYSRDMTFAGETHPANGQAVSVRKRYVVDSDSSTHATTQALVNGSWVTVAKGNCTKTNG